jgi:C4-dicarboxylate-specific signal transduction histidine kinase
MTTEMRNTGVDVVGDMPWGTHFCVFYDTKADLLDTLVSYFRAGLESDEFCLWVVAPPLTMEDAWEALGRSIPQFDRYVTDGSIEIVAARDWYLHDGKFDLERVLAGWHDKLARALGRGYAGVRVTGDTVWLEKNDWKDFSEYEESINVSFANHRMAALCTYPIGACSADEILDVVRTHQFAVTKRHGGCEVIETAGYKQAKTEIKRLNEDLERRVVERTRELTTVNSQLLEEALERQRAEDALRRSEAALIDAQQISHTGSWRWNTDTGEVSWSAELRRIFAMDAAAPLPSLAVYVDMLHVDDRIAFRDALDRAVRDRRRFHHEYRMVLHDGSMKHLYSAGRPDVTESGELEYVGVVMDITERRHAEEALRAAQTELTRAARLTTMGELAASIAHEVNQPLAAIVSNGHAGLRWLNRQTPDLDEARDALARMVGEGKRAGDVIRGLQALARKANPQPTTLDVDDVIREVLALTRSEVQRHGVVLRTELAAHDRPVVGDRVQLQQVLLNLILNGIDAVRTMEHGPRELAVLSALTGADSVLVSVEDSGPGLDPAIASRIFEPFVTTKSDGLGMGLSICRSIIDAHGGRLWVSPRIPYGTALRFTVPSGDVSAVDTRA